MKKIIIIGCPGSGKTTFAEKLHETTGLPLFYLDAIWHKPDRTHISRNEFDERLAEIFSLDKWIIDGNYSRTIEERLIACDTVFLFDLPTDVCLEGAIERLGKGRYDIPWIDSKLDSEFKEKILRFKEENLPRIYCLIEKYRKKREIIVFYSREDSDKYIKSIK